MFVIPVSNERMWVWVVIGAKRDTGPTQFLEGDKCTVNVCVLRYDMGSEVQCEPFRAKDVG